MTRCGPRGTPQGGRGGPALSLSQISSRAGPEPMNDGLSDKKNTSVRGQGIRRSQCSPLSSLSLPQETLGPWEGDQTPPGPKPTLWASFPARAVGRRVGDTLSGLPTPPWACLGEGAQTSREAWRCQHLATGGGVCVCQETQANPVWASGNSWITRLELSSRCWHPGVRSCRGALLRRLP